MGIFCISHCYLSNVGAVVAAALRDSTVSMKLMRLHCHLRVTRLLSVNATVLLALTQSLLRFALGIAKRNAYWSSPPSVCVSVCLCVYISLTVCLRNVSMVPDVTWGNGRGCPLVVHCWVDSQSVHGFLCCGNIYA